EGADGPGIQAYRARPVLRIFLCRCMRVRATRMVPARMPKSAPARQSACTDSGPPRPISRLRTRSSAVNGLAVGAAPDRARVMAAVFLPGMVAVAWSGSAPRLHEDARSMQVARAVGGMTKGPAPVARGVGACRPP